ncbi:MAG TPA: GspH/FimT family pseudopilin [Opitutaceae bacterium]|nr:GspH/FimT family pseudopilin [Opitutaceae bacterium]
MPASPQSNFPPASSRAPLVRSRSGPGGLVRRRRGEGGFTLIELIFVLALLAITATFVASNMAAFFRARSLNFEARRMLSLMHYGQSRAAAEGAPVVLWINPKDSTYGLSLQSNFTDAGGDTHAVSYTADPTIALEVPTTVSTDVSEQDDEKLGLPEGVSAVRFMPDGYFDESSVEKITLRQGTEGALELVPTANRLGYEIRPASNVD